MKSFDPTIASAAASNSISHGFAGGTPLAMSGGLVNASPGLGAHMAQKNTAGAGSTPTHGHYTNSTPKTAMPASGMHTPMPAHTVHSPRF